MDETDLPENRSNDEAELSKSSDENSFIGKMKFGVSKILPNSLSKWLSPKVDMSNARRRRHEEMDSEDEIPNRNELLLGAPVSSQYQTTPQLAAPPPNKKKKTFTEFLNRNTIDLYSPSATPLIGERSNIVSSTLIEDVPNRTNNNQFNRYLPHENGQHPDESPRDNASNYPDEGSSSQSREKPTNIFAINNDSSVVNFSAHLQRAKSLFTNRSYLSPRLKNYRMRNPRSSLYRSTSSLCDNNSVSSNASSAMSSPFYNGQTTFGGASATSRRMNTTLNHDSMQMHHRPKVPTNLVTSRSTSSLNSIGGASTSMSTTAKRILDVMNKYNTPLTEVRRISNALPSISETSALNKRKSILELDTTITSEMDKSKRTILKPNTPYNRPFGRTPIESVLTTELHVPSMPELLQLKKFATNTMKIREIASKSDSVLNKPIAAKKINEFNFMEKPATADLDASNNNKFLNNKNDAIINSSNDGNKQHISKIRSNITKRRVGKCTDGDSLPEPVNLPNISLVMDKKAEIKFSEPFKLQNNDQKTSDNGLQIPFKFKSSNTNALITPATKEKRINGNDTDITKKFEISPVKSSVTTASTVATKSDFVFKSQPALNNNNKSIYKFSEPIFVKSDNAFGQTKFSSGKFNYKFSDPKFVNDTTDSLAKTQPAKSFSNFKFESKPIKGVSSDSGIAETTQSFDSNASKSTGLSVTKPAFSGSTDNGISAGKLVSSLSTQLKEDDTFKSLVAKQKQGKWECKDCMVSNDSSNNKCMCCGSAKDKETTALSTGSSKVDASKSVVVDDVFKSIVAKQKQTKWECKDCCSQNDQAQAKCLCCGGANPNSSTSAVSKDTVNSTVAPKPTFSFGSLPSSSTSATAATSKPVDNVFKAIVDKQKSTWECSACLSANDMSKSKCMCCEQSRDVSKGSNEPAIPKPQFSFGNKEAFAPKNTFSFGSNASTGVSAAPAFSFGSLPASKSTIGQKINEKSKELTSTNGKKDEDKAKESVQSKPISSQFSFGSPAALPSTSKIETVTPIASPVVPAASDNIFKSIVDKQKNASWECTSCLTTNSNDKEKCACCETPKDGSTPKKDFGLSSSQKIVFGSPVSNTFSFGSKQDSKPTFQFGSNLSSSTPLTSTVAPISETKTVSSTSNLFGSSSVTPTFSFGGIKPATTESSQPTPSLLFGASKPVESAPATGGFKFALGSSTPMFGAKDVTDGGTSDTKNVKVLENVLIKPATNGPVDSAKSIFSIGQGLAVNQSTDDLATKAKKRSNTDLAEGSSVKLPATSNTPFIFGQPKTNNAISAIVSKPTTESANTQIQKPTFGFGMSKPATNTFATVQPAFSFNANPTSTPTLPTLGGFKGPSFGSSAPVFGTPTLNTEAPKQATPSPGLFQFGASNNSATSAPLSSEPPKIGGFNFSVGAAPSFNFSEQQMAQPNAPFQFGAATETHNIFATQPNTASSTAIQQRRKLRPVRRVNRP